MSKKNHMKHVSKRRVNRNVIMEFDYNQCDRCCRRSNDIVLNPKDIYYISESLNMTMDEFLDKYCFVCTNHISKIAIAKLKLLEETLRCPFMANNKCTIYQNKPTICLLPQMSNHEFKKTQNHVKICYKPYKVIHDRKDITLDIELQHDHGFMDRWMAILNQLEISLKGVNSQMQDDLSNMAFLILYTNYVQAPFEYQFIENIKILNDIINDIQNKSVDNGLGYLYNE